MIYFTTTFKFWEVPDLPNFTQGWKNIKMYQLIMHELTKINYNSRKFSYKFVYEVIVWIEWNFQTSLKANMSNFPRVGIFSSVMVVIVFLLKYYFIRSSSLYSKSFIRNIYVGVCSKKSP